MAAPAKVFLHIGLHKTGTTFLQNLFTGQSGAASPSRVWTFLTGPASRCRVARCGICKGAAAWRQGSTGSRVHGRPWSTRVNASELPDVLISEERLSIATLKQARRAIEPFRGFGGPHHRDRARSGQGRRLVVAGGCEERRHRHLAGVRRCAPRILHGPRSSRRAGSGVDRTCSGSVETWESALPRRLITSISSPCRPSSADPDALTRRFASVVGFDAASSPSHRTWNNETVGVAGIEVIRRVNERLGWPAQPGPVRLARQTHVGAPAGSSVPSPCGSGFPSRTCPGWPSGPTGWIEAIKGRGYDVVGDLDDLVPSAERTMRRPDEVSEAELLEASLDALAMSSEEYAGRWWARRRKQLRSGGGEA